MTFTPATAAKELKVSRNKVMAWIHNGELAASNLGDSGVPRYRITQAAIDDLLARRAVKQPNRRPKHPRILARTTENFF